MLRPSSASRAAFTLIETSIVLVIIGLITGGIMVSRSVIRQAQINSIMTDTQKYIQAVQQFQQKYNAFPGDMINATSYWGTMATCPPTAGMASPGGTLTCNGDGDGQIAGNSSNAISASEAFLMWQHLANAQMIQGNYSGIAGSAGVWDAVPGSNIPTSRVDGAGYVLAYRGVQPAPTSGAFFYAGVLNHVFEYGGYLLDSYTTGAVLTTIEAQALDTKNDDGVASTGMIQGIPSVNTFTPNCTTSGGAYKLTQSGFQCGLVILTGF